MSNTTLGRLKRSLKTKCPECGNTLQLRVREQPRLVRGETLTTPIEYEVCSIQCGYETEIENKKKRKQIFDKTLVVEPKIDMRQGAKYERNPKPSSTTKSNSSTSPTRHRKFYKRNP